MAKSWSHALLCASLAGALAGCGTVPDGSRLANPRSGNSTLDAGLDGDEPVPRVESPSRSGNPDTYVVFGRRYRVKETSEGYRETGIASWYGWDFHGRKTSSGPPFNMFDLTAAHKSLPIPTYARVTNLENGRSIVVKVNDRGPFIGERLIDLSYAAAARLEMLDQGTTRVEVAALEPYQYLPDLAARRAELRERLAIQAARREQEKEEKADTLNFAREAPNRPTGRLAAATQIQEPSRSAKDARSVASERERDKPVKPVPSARLASATPAAKGRERPSDRLASTAKGRERPSDRLASTAKGREKPSERSTPSASKNGAIYLVGTATERNGARQLQTRLTSQLQRAVQVESGAGSRYEVRVPLRNPGEARQVAVRLAGLGVSRSRIVAD
ncbi:MAG: septal ring lytic transglycosylase RlpA family protein [Candidatus Competibacter sp.]|nr:septal ring lytic transglycosylase RlpA family protein [Candidatus Competibacter sp.]